MAMTPMLVTHPFVDATPLLQDPARLRATAAEEGFLVFRGILPVERVQLLREEICAILASVGWLDTSVPATECLLGSHRPEAMIDHDPQYRAVYNRILSLRSFHALALSPELIAALEILFDRPVLAHPRNIARIIFPNLNAWTTPPHQDYLHIKGTENTWTAWTPIGDCPLTLGGLAVAARTHTAGLLKHKAAYGAGGAGLDMPEDALWYEGDMHMGDLILMHSLCVHQGRDNHTPDRIRLSCDFRYQPMDEPVAPSSLLPHMNWATWPELYANWPADDPMKYYWQDMPLVVEG